MIILPFVLSFESRLSIQYKSIHKCLVKLFEELLIFLESAILEIVALEYLDLVFTELLRDPLIMWHILVNLHKYFLPLVGGWTD